MAPKTVAEFWKNLNREIQAGKEAAIKEGVTLLYQATKDELAKGSPGRGRKYKRGRKRYHRASVSGDAPARDLGNLQRGIAFQILKGPNPSGVVGVKENVAYAKYLDPPKGKKEPDIGRRPFLSSAFDKNEKRIRQAMTDELERHLEKVTR